jgi:hypothetical protein
MLLGGIIGLTVDEGDVGVTLMALAHPYPHYHSQDIHYHLFYTVYRI